MPPQGESSGYCIEDAVLLAHVFSRRDCRDVETLFSDYESLRRAAIDRYYKEAAFRWGSGNQDSSLAFSILIEWLTIMYIMFMNWRATDQYGNEVWQLKLPK
jgi:2-polyprenyl-6-methoxyphenol hydroxylase-like FAD-dependent oxidoreductase